MLQITFRDGRALSGRYISVSRQHFIVCHGPCDPLHGRAEGPLERMVVRAVTVLKTRAEVLQEARDRLLGELVPGREPVTRADYQARLEILAAAMAQAEDWQRQIQIGRQFDAVADRIRLAAGKRAWMRKEAKWRRRSNVPPSMADLWCGDVASPCCFARRRPQNLDPDPRIRRRRSARRRRCGQTRSLSGTCSRR